MTLDIPRPGEWAAHGHCVGSAVPDLWHSNDTPGRPDSEDTTVHSDDVQLAIDICRGCPVRISCLEYALEVPLSQDWGVWGGTTARQRANLRRRLARAAA